MEFGSSEPYDFCRWLCTDREWQWGPHYWRVISIGLSNSFDEESPPMLSFSNPLRKKQTPKSRPSNSLVRWEDIYEPLPCQYTWKRSLALLQLHQVLLSHHQKSLEQIPPTFDSNRAYKTVPGAIGYAEVTYVSGLDILCYQQLNRLFPSAFRSQ